MSLQDASETVYLIPYVLGALVLWLLLMFFRIYETWYCGKTDRVLYRDLFIFRTLSRKKKNVLSTFHFYTLLPFKEQRRFEHRVKKFLNETRFLGRDGMIITPEVEVLIAATAIMLTFGRKRYTFNYVDTILVYPEVFYSRMNDEYHKGEFNPIQRTIVFSWSDFKEGYRITDDNLNVGIHEFVHALQIEALKSNDIDSLRFECVFQRILKRLSEPMIKEKLAQGHFLRAYAFTNEYEFMAALVENFFESPEELKNDFPEIYRHIKTLLNFNFAHY